jgi:hypothetical protein
MRPPLYAQTLVALAAPASEYDVVAGDLEEEYVRRARELGAAAASRWYWRQAVLSLPSLLSYSRSNRTPLRQIGIAGISLAVLLLMVCVPTFAQVLYQGVFGDIHRAPHALWFCINYAESPSHNVDATGGRSPGHV